MFLKKSSDFFWKKHTFSSDSSDFSEKTYLFIWLIWLFWKNIPFHLTHLTPWEPWFNLRVCLKGQRYFYNITNNFTHSLNSMSFIHLYICGESIIAQDPVEASCSISALHPSWFGTCHIVRQRMLTCDNRSKWYQKDLSVCVCCKMAHSLII